MGADAADGRIEQLQETLHMQLTGRSMPSNDIHPAKPQQVFVVVSAPEFGPDDEGGFAFPVMQEIQKLLMKFLQTLNQEI